MSEERKESLKAWIGGGRTSPDRRQTRRGRGEGKREAGFVEEA